jgi:hypothetical protein
LRSDPVVMRDTVRPPHMLAHGLAMRAKEDACSSKE